MVSDEILTETFFYFLHFGTLLSAFVFCSVTLLGISDVELIHCGEAQLTRPFPSKVEHQLSAICWNLSERGERFWGKQKREHMLGIPHLCVCVCAGVCVRVYLCVFVCIWKGNSLCVYFDFVLCLFSLLFSFISLKLRHFLEEFNFVFNSEWIWMLNGSNRRWPRDLWPLTYFFKDKDYKRTIKREKKKWR